MKNKETFMARTSRFAFRVHDCSTRIPRNVETSAMNHGNGERLLRNMVAIMIVLLQIVNYDCDSRCAEQSYLLGESLNDKQCNILFLS